MSEARTGGCGSGASHRGSGAASTRGVVALGVAGCLHLAAAPVFAIMALLTGVLGGGPMDAICSPAQDSFPLGGMVPMYLLMSAFHLAPWLKLITAWRSGPPRKSQ